MARMKLHADSELYEIFGGEVEVFHPEPCLMVDWSKHTQKELRAFAKRFKQVHQDELRIKGMRLDKIVRTLKRDGFLIQTRHFEQWN